MAASAGESRPEVGAGAAGAEVAPAAGRAQTSAMATRAGGSSENRWSEFKCRMRDGTHAAGGWRNPAQGAGQLAGGPQLARGAARCSGSAERALHLLEHLGPSHGAYCLTLALNR